MNIDVLWLKASPKPAEIEFRKMTRLQAETQYKELYLDGFNFNEVSAKWLLKSIVNVQKLSILNTKIDNLDLYKYASRLPKLRSFSK